MKYDLHIHTNCSDGKYSKIQLLKYLNDNKFQCVAFADHNYIELESDGNINKQYFLNYNEKQTVDMINAIEFDVLENRYLHILGYDIKNKRKVHEIIQNSKRINTEITKKIINNIWNVYGIDINVDELITNSSDGNISKRNITDWIVKNGFARNYIEAGLLYTSKESPCYEKKYSLKTKEVLEIIHQCGGYSIMAHPFSLKLDEEATKSYIYELVKNGLMGIEVNNLDKTSVEQMKFLKKIANDLSIFQTSGSDFHNEIITPMIGLQDTNSDSFIKMIRR